MNQQICDIQNQIAELAPLTDAQIQSMVDAGGDPVELLQAERTKADQRRALGFKLASLEKQQAEAKRQNSTAELARLKTARAGVERQAQNAMDEAWQAARTLKVAMARFAEYGDQYQTIAHDMALTARHAGLNHDDMTGLHPDVATLEALLLSALTPYRRPKPFNRKLIQPSEA